MNYWALTWSLWLVARVDFKAEWHQLKLYIRSKERDIQGLSNIFYRRLLNIIHDENASVADRVAAYRDALLAAPAGEIASLPLIGFHHKDARSLHAGGVIQDSAWQEVELSDAFELKSDEGVVCLNNIYSLTKRRKIGKYPIDPSLSSLLNDDSYKFYNGYAQQMAVRLGLTTNHDETLIVNLPTGSGKTLVAHALCGFSPTNKFTLVIVPTVGLSIEQGKRALGMLEKMGLTHGGCYFWHGQQDVEVHNDIKNRIRNGTQKILFCSPESACRSLLPTLFYAAKNNILANVIIDEAHLVDQWGADFRPYFQIFSAVFHSLRKISKSGIKCCLMSATFTEKTLNIVSELFTDTEKSAIEIHGSFLRPEIQYAVHRVEQVNHLNEVVMAIRKLPKPLIVYTVTRSDAESIYSGLRDIGYCRVGLFTGDVSASLRATLLEKWSLDKIDIMVATSAFGVGMDKENVRSILHAAIPENLDRFYQEVGRAGRDGLACQSLVVYHNEQFRIAEQLNDQRLITEDLGRKRWKIMWETGEVSSSGNKIIDIKTVHKGLQGTSDSNEEWNWRTLLLMQRSGMIEIILEPPNPPEWNHELDEITNQKKRSKYFDYYYRSIVVSPVIDDHLSHTTWEKRIGQQRSYEKTSQKQGFTILRQWIVNSRNIPFCKELQKFYMVRHKQPEYVCGGCPGCRSEGRDSSAISTVGLISHVIGLEPPKKWNYPIKTDRLHIPVYYSSDGITSEARLIRLWINWISEFLEQGTIKAIRADASILTQINKRLPTGLGLFWIGIQLNQDIDECSYWPELVLVMPSAITIPDLGWEESPKLLVAPEGISDPDKYNCNWWEKDHTARSLNNFLSGLNHGHH